MIKNKIPSLVKNAITYRDIQQPFSKFAFNSAFGKRVMRLRFIVSTFRLYKSTTVRQTN